MRPGNFSTIEPMIEIAVARAAFAHPHCNKPIRPMLSGDILPEFYG